MIERELEEVVRQAWVQSAIPLTDENVARLSGLPRSDVEHGMRQLMRKGVVDMDVDASGQILWCVRGLQRAAAAPPPPPPKPAADATAALKASATAALETPPGSAKSSAIVAAPPPAPRTATAEPAAKKQPHLSVSVPGARLSIGFATDPDRKSILLSGGASLLFGPFGWLYAAPWKELVPAVVLYTALVALFPKFLVATLLGVLHPTCGVLGMLYAYRYNQTKRRTPLLLVARPPEGQVVARDGDAPRPGG